jgi:hypothetical protein
VPLIAGFDKRLGGRWFQIPLTVAQGFLILFQIEKNGFAQMTVWRPERRNRNIGTGKSGRSRSNDMRIPESWLDKHGNCLLFYERLDHPDVEDVVIGKASVRFLADEPHAGYSHGCTPADVIKLLRLASAFVPVMPDMIVFRQPTRRQSRQSPVWGRFLYCANFGRNEGTAIVLEAQDMGSLLKWPKRMSLEDRAEFERLIEDGHVFLDTGRRFEAQLSARAVRNTTLYRTLLHELGHLVDHHQKVLCTETALDPDRDIAGDLYFSGPVSEREAFAHRFADELGQSLRARGEIPFAPQILL